MENSKSSFPGDSESDSKRLEVFGELLAECHRELFGFIYSLVQHHADAEDVYQKVAILLWEKFDTFEIGTNFAAWATTVAQYTSRDFIRSRRRNAITFSDEVIDSIAAAYTSRQTWGIADTSEALETCLQKLPEKDRRLVEGCYSQNKSFASIAKEENRTLGAIYQAICRIRKNLYACVKRTLAQEGY